jgi:hypothetical protein
MVTVGLIDHAGRYVGISDGICMAVREIGL